MFYSYRVKYSGVLASLFLSSRETLLMGFMLLGSTFSCVSFALIESNLDEFSPWIFLFRVFNSYARSYDIACQIFDFGSQNQYSKVESQIRKDYLILQILNLRSVMPLKSKKRKAQKKRLTEVNMDAARILRTVRDQEAFYFYEALGRPTGESARSLLDFLEKVKSVKLECLLFHLQRKDFQNWIKKTLGDSKLARKMGRTHPSYSEDIRTKIYSSVENRIKELSVASAKLLVNEGLAVASVDSPL